MKDKGILFTAAMAKAADEGAQTFKIGRKRSG